MYDKWGGERVIFTQKMQKRLLIVIGHYGTGKTNLSLNLALETARGAPSVAPCVLVDLDIVNPYFRSSDHAKLLEEGGVRLIAQSYNGSNVDQPFISPEINSIFDGEESEKAIFDVGGDDAGAYALGQFAEKFKTAGYEMYYVVNYYRNLTRTPDEAVGILREIEVVSQLKATAIVNNSHLCGETNAETVRKSMPFARETAHIAGLPLLFTAVPDGFDEYQDQDIENPFPVKIYVKKPWEK